MKIDVLLKKLSSRMIMGLTALLFLWCLVFVIKQSLKYTIFSAVTETLFMTTILGALVLLFALATLNIAANLNIISEHLMEKNGSQGTLNYKKVYVVVFAAVLILTAVTAAGLHGINAFNTTKTSKRIIEEMNELKTSYAVIIDELAMEVGQERSRETVQQLLRLVEANAPSVRHLEILFPKVFNERLVYLRINTWGGQVVDSRFSKLSESFFAARNKDQRDYLNDVYYRNAFEDKAFIERPTITVYSPVVRNGKVAFIFYSNYNEIQGRFLKSSYD